MIHDHHQVLSRGNTFSRLIGPQVFTPFRSSDPWGCWPVEKRNFLCCEEFGLWAGFRCPFELRFSRLTSVRLLPTPASAPSSSSRVTIPPISIGFGSGTSFSLSFFCHSLGYVGGTPPINISPAPSLTESRTSILDGRHPLAPW